MSEAGRGGIRVETGAMGQRGENSEPGGLKADNLSHAGVSLRTEKVLLLEDHEAFAAVVQDFLECHRMEVDRGVSGVEGLKYVMASDYDFIVCDMVMPEFPGEMFYRAVERIKPHLCQRFIFVTGHKGDEKIREFILNVKGLVLWKPFALNCLLEAIATIRSLKAKTRAPRASETSAWRRTVVNLLNN